MVDHRVPVRHRTIHIRNRGTHSSSGSGITPHPHRLHRRPAWAVHCSRGSLVHDAAALTFSLFRRCSHPARWNPRVSNKCSRCPCVRTSTTRRVNTRTPSGTGSAAPLRRREPELLPPCGALQASGAYSLPEPAAISVPPAHSDRAPWQLRPDWRSGRHAPPLFSPAFAEDADGLSWARRLRVQGGKLSRGWCAAHRANVSFTYDARILVCHHFKTGLKRLIR